METIYNMPQPAFALLDFGSYFKLNHVLSVARGWQLGQPTERVYPMNPTPAKVNITYDSEGNELSYDIAFVMPVSAEVQENYSELIEGLELVKSYIPADLEETENAIVEGEIETDVIDWTLNHCQAQGVDNSKLVTYIASQDATNYPPIPNEGEWCEAKVYSYNGNKVKCLQPHTRMHFTPEETPALWLIIETVTQGYSEWVQPTGAHDAYQIGDRVTHQGFTWECTTGDGSGNNSWEPGVYGWKKI